MPEKCTPLDAALRVVQLERVHAGLRHSFVSLLSDSGMSIEQISRLMGHNGTAVTELVYRHHSGRWSELPRSRDGA